MAERVRVWLQSLECALQARDARAAAELFQEEQCFWRDLVAFTWNYYTAESREDIEAMLAATLEHTKPSGWAIEREVEEREDGNLVEAFIKFETVRARGKGRVKLRGDKCWCLLTAMQELKGHEERAAVERRKEEEVQALGRSKQPYCLIVGGGQCGTALAAYLDHLGVPTIVLEKKKRAGDTWRERYRSLHMHSMSWTDHMPYMPFPKDWPLFSSKDEIGDWLEAYTQAMDLVYWSSTECKSAQFDEVKKHWVVTVEREGEEMMLYPKQLVLCTSLHGLPSTPSFKGAQQFQGVQIHSSAFKGGDEWAGKHCVLIGTGNSAHDIATDAFESGAASVTMVQRGTTLVVPRDVLMELFVPVYNFKYTTAEADLLMASVPHKVLPRMQRPMYEKIEEMCADFYKGLREAGFKHSFGEDGAGFFAMLLRRASGYYINIGASELVIKGDVKVKSGVEVEEIKANSIVLSDGTELHADVIVYATGYEGGIGGSAARLISQEVADKVGKCWGLGSNTAGDPGPWERELRNMWKPTHQEALWFHAGGFIDARFHSRLLALQLKARMERIPTPVYGLPHVHHTS